MNLKIPYRFSRAIGKVQKLKKTNPSPSNTSFVVDQIGMQIPIVHVLDVGDLKSHPIITFSSVSCLPSVFITTKYLRC